MSVEFKDNSVEVINIIGKATENFLEEAGALVESQAMRNTRVDTGQTKSKWSHVVDKGASAVTIGNPLENAIWEEFGTGEYAINGDGRKTPWVYKHTKYGFVRTTGKRPTRALHKAMESCKSKIEKQAKTAFGSELK